jgi:iron complex outermembrane receptor protein
MKLIITSITLLSLLFSFPVFVLSQDKEITLEPVVITATRDTQEIRKIPANVTVITSEQIEKSNALNTVDLLRNEMGIIVRDWTGSGKTVTLDIRGFGETGPLNTLVLVDGRRVNEIDLSGVDWTQIPLDQIERIEIVRGPGSVLYGDNAVGGVINIITKKPLKPFSMKGEITLGSYHFNKENASIEGKWKDLSAMINATYKGTEGYRDNSFFRGKDLGGKIIYDLNENLIFNLNTNIHKDNYGMPGAVPYDIYKIYRRYTKNPNDKAETEDNFILFGSKLKLGKFGRFEVDLSYRDRHSYSSFYYFSPFFSSIYNLKIDTITQGVTPKYILEMPLWKFNNKLILGVDLYKSEYELDSKNISSFFGITTIDIQKNDVTKKSAGPYFLNELSILDDLILSFGLRNERVTYDAFQKPSLLKYKKKDNEYAWNLGLDYLFSKQSSAFFSVKRSFRFPVVEELFQFYPTLVTNYSLKPQRGYHYETGMRHIFNQQIEGNITFFWSDIKNEIFYNPYTSSNENYSKTRRNGIETGTSIKLYPWLKIWANYTYIKPILKGMDFSGNDIPGVPRHKVSIGGDFDLGKGFLLNTNLNIIGSRYFIADWANQAERLDGYYTWDAKLSYSWKGFKGYIGINNITNRKYAEYGALNWLGQPNFYPSPERNFFGGISYIF